MSPRIIGEQKPYFMGVAIATILVGAALVAVSLVELGGNLWFDTGFSEPFMKLLGSLAVTSLGYIHMELESLRIKK